MRSSVLCVVLIVTPIAAAAEAQVANLEAKVDHHLTVLMAEIGPAEVAPEKREDAMRASLRDLAAAGPAAVRAAREAYDRWSRAKAPDPATAVRPGEMRWRAVHLLGSLGQRDAIPTLHRIARTPLPEPLAVSEQFYGDEYRIRLRAIAGLENLKAIDELKDIYEAGGVLRNPAAASLFELGINVGRVRRVDAKTALQRDAASPKDHHPNKGRAPQAEKPGSPRADVKGRPDTPSVERKQ